MRRQPTTPQSNAPFLNYRGIKVELLPAPQPHQHLRDGTLAYTLSSSLISAIAVFADVLTRIVLPAGRNIV
jgi:hypothetical protein